MIFKRSRYEFDRVFRAPLNGTRDQVVPAVLHVRPTTFSPQTTPYIWCEGDRIERMAERMYGTATQWWRIAEANPQIDDVERIKVGTVIRVPRV